MYLNLTESTVEALINTMNDQNAALEEKIRALETECDDLKQETQHFEQQAEMAREAEQRAKQTAASCSFEEMMDLIDPNFVNNNKINCIKYIRTITRCGLKEAKDFFEQVWTPAIRAAQSARDSGREVDLTAARAQLKDLFT